MTIDERELTWAAMVLYGIATDNEIELVTDIRGYSMESLNEIIYARTGYHSIEQYEESELDEPDDTDSDLGFDPFMGSYSYDC